jgi:hypothetical protein
MSYNSSFAVMQNQATYPDSESFLAAEGSICKLATDGCNNITIDNGQLGASTLMACLQDDGMTMKSPVWSCSAYQDDIMFMTGVPLMTGVSNGLSDNDQSQYDTFKERIGQKRMDKLEKIIEKYQQRLAKISIEKQSKIHIQMIDLMDKKISTFLFQFPADR